mmetsp:Transcript_19873/g.57100  ORF Transcript_19873/g.57100 Transcript_19873/m.57100 type:complete len:156 (+) Transcript_19873:1228-1695(+)
MAAGVIGPAGIAGTDTAAAAAADAAAAVAVPAPVPVPVPAAASAEMAADRHHHWRWHPRPPPLIIGPPGGNGGPDEAPVEPPLQPPPVGNVGRPGVEAGGLAVSNRSGADRPTGSRSPQGSAGSSPLRSPRRWRWYHITGIAAMAAIPLQRARTG